MTVSITAEFEAPGRGPAGLAWDGRTLWHADYREGLIYRLNDAAEVLGTLWCPGTLSGLTWDGRHLWQVILDEAVVHSIDPVTTDFDQTIELRAHGRLSGVAWDGGSLRVAAQESGEILTVGRESGQVVGRLAGPVAIGDIDHAAGSLWLSVATPMVYSSDGGFSWISETRDYALVQMDATTGREISRHPLSRLYTGLAWVGDDVLWLASSTERKLYRATLIAD